MRRVGINPIGISREQEASSPAILGITDSATIHNIINLLETKYPPMCIGAYQDEIEAHRYAGKVELSQEILKALKKETEDMEDE